MKYRTVTFVCVVKITEYEANLEDDDEVNDKAWLKMPTEEHRVSLSKIVEIKATKNEN